MAEKFKSLPVNCDLSYSTVTDCLRHMLPADRYDIVGGSRAYWDAKMLVSVAWSKSNPFTPQVNVHYDSTLGENEWYINPIRYAEMGDRNVDCWGSKGV
jgi:hypothetical protein